MSGLFNTFNITKRGMFAQQTALNVVAHNISNANTEGYSVQRANLKTTQPFGMPSLTTAAEPGQLGTGVEVASITRSRDVFLDSQIRKENSTLGKYEARQQFLSEIESIFTEPSDTGLSTMLSNFWDSWSQLSNTPEPNSTARTLVAQNADSLCTAINHNYEQLCTMQSNASSIIQQKIFEVNSILTQIQDLNVQIKAVSITGQQPNDLLDRRDLLLDQLSEMFSFSVDETNYKGIQINANIVKDDGSVDEQILLKDGSINYGVAYINKIEADSSDPTKYNMEIYINGDPNKKVTISGIDKDKYKDTQILFYDKTNYEKNGTLNISDISPAKFNNGSLNGYESINKEIEEYKIQLNNLARSLAIAVNTIHSDNGVGIDFFDASAETAEEPAAVIKVSQDILDDPKKINAGKVIDTSDSNYSEGNGERALLISQIRNLKMDILSIKVRDDFINDVSFDSTNLTIKGNSKGMTIDNYFKSTITSLGVSSQEAERMVTNQEALLSQLETRKESISGVSIDEEITNMIQFQRAYQANAKMISVIDELLDVVVNGLIKR
ncbi:flagellar hook-associated protein FlgK [Caloramator sp. E03]|uniref:flagellar hook-associated protein FlgK n=1 Tax=Caloramator sp. E03 TaxID=2576307 RepID=UPI001110E7FF|nr:flagellar hook-associated protein FlgK [Caloramator sp. E03]QCX32375.1 flagellar hook-associated protein FlgK [Caloramator sp. E03]